ncbi:MAG: site-2 protease family protein [Thermodesulfobacteriota bacterium]
MLGRGIKLFRVLGIQISVDYTWFIIFIFFAWTLAYGYFPYMNPGLDRRVYLGMGFFSSLALFACVLIHELSHSYTSNRLGLEIKEITLFIFGGVAQLTREPDRASDELKIAVAGPIASGVLAGLFYVAWRLIDPEAHVVASAIVKYLAIINLVLLIFNLIPGFPLDGGRVLRAIWWWKTGDFERATRLTSRIGKLFALFLIITGFMRIFTGNFIGGLWSVLIGVFLQQAAESGYRQVVMKLALEGVKVRDIMARDVVSMDASETVATAVERYFLPHHYVSFPVLSDSRVVGLLTLNNVRAVPKDEWETTSVRDVMHGIEATDVLSPDDAAEGVLGRMTGDNLGRFPVVEDGELKGIVTRRDIMRVMQFKTELKR